MVFIVLLGLLAILADTDEGSFRECEIAMGEFRKAIPRDRCIAFSVECKTAIQRISCRIVAYQENVFITGSANFLPDVSNRQIADSPHSFCGPFKIISDGKKHLRYQQDRYEILETLDPILPVEIAYTPKDWICSPDFGDLGEFTRKVASTSEHDCASRVGEKTLIFETVYRPSPSDGRLELHFDTNSRFSLNRFSFVSRDTKESKPCFESQLDWIAFGDIFVPTRRVDWRYTSNKGKAGPFRQAKFADFSFVFESELVKDFPENSLPFGTLRTIIRNGVVQKRFVGGSRGEAEHQMRSVAHQIRTRLGLYHDSK